MRNSPLKTQGFAQGIYEQSVIQKEELDTVRVMWDGRMYAYARAGATALGVGKMTQGPIPSGNANKETLYADVAIGGTVVYVTFGGAVTKDFYKGGYLWANDDAGEGTWYRIKGHPAGTTAVAVQLDDTCRIAMTAGATTISCIQNRQNLVVIADVTSVLTSQPAGVPPIAVTEYYYFWNQVKGPCAVLTSGTVVIGNPVAMLTTDGAVGAMATDSILTSLGVVMSVNLTTEYSLINLAIPGY